MRIHRILLIALAVGCASPPPPGLPRIKFSELDANEDGVVDAEEFKTLADAVFTQLDADGDGKISQAEYERFVEQRRPPQRRHHGGGRPGGGMDGGFPGGGGGPY